MKKKKVQNILFLIIGVVLMCIAIIPLIQSSELNSPIYLTESSRVSIFRYMFLYMFLSIIFLIPGLNLFLNNKIEKIFSIKRIFYVAIILTVFLLILMNIIFPPKLFWL